MLSPINKMIELGDGRTVTIETGKLAKQADGVAAVRMNNTMLLATACTAKDANPGVDSMPLQVKYREKYPAFERFPRGFAKREGKVSDHEILTSRLVDRALHPLFLDNYHAEIYVGIILFSTDGEDLSDASTGLATSVALTVFDIPFNGSISEVHVTRTDGEYIVSPISTELEKADINIIVAATIDNIMMVEGEMNEVQEPEMLKAIKVAHEAIKVQCKTQLKLSEACGKLIKREYCHEVNSDELHKDVRDKRYAEAYTVATSSSGKHEHSEAFEKIVGEYKAQFSEEELMDEKPEMVGRYYHDVEEEAVRRAIFDEGKCLGGHKTTEIRPIQIETDCLPGPRGSAIFTRGEIQPLSTVTLGTKSDEKMIDDVPNRGYERFLSHYNFPPFFTGKAKATCGVGRREIGHGNLAHCALKCMIPDSYPYMIHVISDVLESSGSSFMVTVCVGTLALRDVSVPVREPVFSTAMGLISENRGTNYAILSDILDGEDHLGDMDFRVTGTKNGIATTQTDIKIGGLSYEVLESALAQAKEGRIYVLGKILEARPEIHEDLKPHAPRTETMTIGKESIDAVIDPDNKIVQGTQEKTEATVSIDEVGGVGRIEVSGTNKAMIDVAVKVIKAIVVIPEIEEVCGGKISSIMLYGASVEFISGKDGLLYISEIDWKRLEIVEQTGLREGDTVSVKLVDTDPKTGKFKPSREILLPKPESYEERLPGPERDERRPRQDHGDRGPRQGRGDRGPRREYRD